MSGTRLLSVIIASLLVNGCADAAFDTSGSHVALADRHDFDERGNAFLRFEEDRTFSFLLSGAEFTDAHWLGLSVRKQRVIEDEIKSHDAVLVQNIPLLSIQEGAELSLDPIFVLVNFAEPGRFVDDEVEFLLTIDEADIEPTSGTVEGTLTFGSLVYDANSSGGDGEADVPQRQTHEIEVELEVGRERVVKENLRSAGNFLRCAIAGENCF